MRTQTVPFADLIAGYEERKSEIDAATARVAASGWYVLGAEVEAFEEEFASYVGTRHCVGVANGTEALMLALVASDVGPGDEVLVSAHTCTPTWLAITHAGATPVPVDARRDTWNMDPELLATAVTPRTRAIVPVHMYGQPADMDAIAAVAKKNSLLIVEDAAQAHGAAWRARRAGSLGHAAAWSFYPTKNLGAHGDAGAVTTDDPMLAERIRSLRSYGWRTRYSSAERGYNSRLDELQAAILRAKLPALDIWNGRRRSVAATYLASLGPSEIALPTVADDAYPSWHLFVVRSTERDELRHHLAELGVQTLVHYPVAPHRQPAFEALGYLPGSLPVAEALADEVVSLPIGPHLPDTAVDQVVEAVASFRHGAGPR